MKLKHYVKEMRVHHYLKNLLVFAPLACSGQLFVFGKLLPAFYTFLSFCFASSAIYLINDIQDVEKDRNHPVKRNRPIAAGKITIKAAVFYTVFLLAAAAACSALCFNVRASLILLAFFLMNLGYSFGLKNIPLLDISALRL